MLSWAMTCFFIALIAMLFGFQDVVGLAPESTWLFVAVAVAILLAGASGLGRADLP
jgi:uncharacterized membrane protein YtjA (UPF0391 family)